MRRGPFLVIDILLLVLCGLLYWNGRWLGGLEKRLCGFIDTHSAPQLPPVVTIITPLDINFAVQVGRQEGDGKIYYTTISPGGPERQTMARTTAEISQTFTIPRGDVVVITCVRQRVADNPRNQ